MSADELVENFSLFDDWEERYTYLIEMGRRLPPMEDTLKTESTRVQGCTSQVWLVPVGNDQVFQFIADSDSQIVRGLIAVLREIYSGVPRQEIPSIDIDEVFQKLGLEEHLTPNRRNGFFAMVERIKTLAQV